MTAHLRDSDDFPPPPEGVAWTTEMIPQFIEDEPQVIAHNQSHSSQNKFNKM
jgi:hypothetical protein